MAKGVRILTPLGRYIRILTPLTKILKILTSSIQDGNATIKWYDDRIDHIEITSKNGQFMPAIPVLDASSLHLHDLMDGTYRVQFKSEGEVIYNKEITVQR